MKRKITEQLIRWKNSSDRKPMILNGARQVGKTFILREFGKEHYQNTIYINLELNHYAASLFDKDISPERLIKFPPIYLTLNTLVQHLIKKLIYQ